MKVSQLEITNMKSFGAETQKIDFTKLKGITLIMGENHDVVDTNTRNGCGKSTIMDALCFVLTDKPVKKSKTKGGLVNRYNQKGMVVTLLFNHIHQGS